MSVASLFSWVFVCMCVGGCFWVGRGSVAIKRVRHEHSGTSTISCSGVVLEEGGEGALQIGNIGICEGTGVVQPNPHPHL